MEKKYSNLFFIPRGLYEDLMSSKVDLTTLAKHIKSPYNSNLKELSPLTLGVLKYFDVFVGFRLLSNTSHSLALKHICLDLNLNFKEENYIDSHVKSLALRDEEDVYPCTETDPLTEESTKCYEILPLPDEKELLLLVIVEEGFLTDVIKSKVELKEFHLSLLKHCYDQGSNWFEVMHEYLGLQMDSNHFNLVSNRLNRH